MSLYRTIRSWINKSSASQIWIWNNTENMVHTAQQFAQELDIAVQIEAADWPRNLVMDGKKLEKAGIRFDTTQQGIRHCLRDYGLASR